MICDFAYLILEQLQREAGSPSATTNRMACRCLGLHHRFGEQRGLHHVAIEVRQDLITDDEGQKAWGGLLARLLPSAYRELIAAERLKQP